MAVRPEDLKTPEGRRLDLTTRAPGPAVTVPPALAAALDDLKTLRARIAEAKRATPQAGDFARGWKSAIRSIAGDD